MTQLTIPSDLLINTRQLPDGSTTTDVKDWLQQWAQHMNHQFIQGKLDLYNEPGYDPDTGQLLNSYIERVATEQRVLN